MSHFVLVDCNNFYASCERLFNPRLEGKPVIVLSNNDGCVVARSQEAKQLGIGMGEPFFKIKQFCQEKRVSIYSSNYQLYGDLSQRVMTLLEERAPDIQVYSIDEAFLAYPDSFSSETIETECIDMRRLIKQWVGIPTSLGIGPTKTLAKIANDLAKKNREVGIFNLSSPAVQEEMLKKFPIGDVWGIGSRSAEKLKALGVFTAWDLREMPPLVIRNKMGVVGERIVWELCGIPCMSLEEMQPKKSIAFSRSFGKTVTSVTELAEALSSYAATACAKLRQQTSCAQALCIYLEALLDFKEGGRQHFSSTLTFAYPTNDTPHVIESAKRCLQQLFRKGERYKKCGVILLDLIPESHVVPDLFYTLNPKRRRAALAVDALNARFGKDSLFYGAMGVNPLWKVRADRRSRRYTTCWDELAIVK